MDANKYTCQMLRQVKFADKNCVPNNVLRHVFAWHVFVSQRHMRVFFLFLIDL